MGYRAPIFSNTSIYAGVHKTTTTLWIMACEAGTTATRQKYQGKHGKQVSHTSATMGLTVLLDQTTCTIACMAHFCNSGSYHRFRKTDLRISIKDLRRGIVLMLTPFSTRQFFASRPIHDPVCLSR
jgi:hypothetical protein